MKTLLARVPDHRMPKTTSRSIHIYAKQLSTKFERIPSVQTKSRYGPHCGAGAQNRDFLRGAILEAFMRKTKNAHVRGANQPGIFLDGVVYYGFLPFSAFSVTS